MRARVEPATCLLPPAAGRGFAVEHRSGAFYTW